MTTQTIVNNEFIDNSVEVHRNDPGNTVQMEVIQSDNSSTSSRAVINIKSGGASSGDASIVYSTGATDFSIGIDNSDSDYFCLSGNAALGTTNVGKCYTTGEWIYPLNPAFNVDANGAVKTNLTGYNYTEATIPFDTERLDIGSNYNTGTYKYTIPKSGIYMMDAEIRMTDTSTSVLLEVLINGGAFNFGAACNRASTPINIGQNVIGVMQFDAADEAYISVVGYGEATNRWDLISDRGRSYFQGALVS